MSRPLASWSWSEPIALSVPSYYTARLAAAKCHQARLTRAWRRDREVMLARIEQILAKANNIPAEELEAEQIRITAPLGELI